MNHGNKVNVGHWNFVSIDLAFGMVYINNKIPLSRRGSSHFSVCNHYTQKTTITEGD